MITRQVPFGIYPTPQELAEEWCSMDADMQAEFFNAVHNITSSWKSPLCMQLQYISYSEKLNDGGRSVMSTIGDYAYGNVLSGAPKGAVEV